MLTRTRVAKVAKAFSGGTLLRTLFSPWKQLITDSGHDAALGDKMRALLDNIVSRFVGFMVRSITLFAALITITIVFVINIALVVVWPLVPVLPFACVIAWVVVA